MRCPICSSKKVKENVYSSPLTIKEGKINSPITVCSNGGVHYRNINYTSPKVQSHFDVVTYVSDEYEKFYRESREPFFLDLIKEIFIYSPSLSDKSRKNFLDIGCSYGHLMDIFKKYRFDVYGIEINARLRMRLNDKGYKVFRTINDLPKEEKFDVIAMIDSLYYFESPHEILIHLGQFLAKNGLLIIRITNRTWLANIFLNLNMSVPYILMGDAKYSFTPKSIKILVENSGLEIKKIIFGPERKKKQTIKKKLYYIFTELFSQMGILISPGLIYFVGKK